MNVLEYFWCLFGVIIKTKNRKIWPFVAEILDFEAKIGRVAGPILLLRACSYAEVLRDGHGYIPNNLITQQPT